MHIACSLLWLWLGTFSAQLRRTTPPPQPRQQQLHTHSVTAPFPHPCSHTHQPSPLTHPLSPLRPAGRQLPMDAGHGTAQGGAAGGGGGAGRRHRLLHGHRGADGGRGGLRHVAHQQIQASGSSVGVGWIREGGACKQRRRISRCAALPGRKLAHTLQPRMFMRPSVSQACRSCSGKSQGTDRK